MAIAAMPKHCLIIGSPTQATSYWFRMALPEVNLMRFEVEGCQDPPAFGRRLLLDECQSSRDTRIEPPPGISRRVRDASACAHRNPLTRMAPGAGSVRDSVGGARDRLGRGGQFGRSTGNPFPVFGFLAPRAPLPCTENPRVDGSIDPKWLKPIPALRAGSLRSPVLIRLANRSVPGHHSQPLEFHGCFPALGPASGARWGDPRTSGQRVSRRPPAPRSPQRHTSRATTGPSGSRRGPTLPSLAPPAHCRSSHRVR
jgi:hypothetical protein